MSSIRSTLLLLCLSFNLSSISATTPNLSLRDLQPRMMGGGMGGAGKKSSSEDTGAGGASKMGGGLTGGAGGAGAGGGASKMGGGLTGGAGSGAGGGASKMGGGLTGGAGSGAGGGASKMGGGLTGGAGGGAGDAGAGGCGKYVIVSARGTSERQKNPTGYAGFIKGLMKQVPGGSNYEVVYPATVDYTNGPKQGANDAMKYISSRKGKCPSSKLVLIGYSEGAMVVTQLLSKQGFPAESVSSIILYGNPYWTAGKQWNAGTAKAGKGIASMMGVKLPPSFGPKTQDICLTGDMICCGGTMGPHLRYAGSQYEKEAVSYSAKMLNGGGASAGDPKQGSGGTKAMGGMKGMGGMGRLRR